MNEKLYIRFNHPESDKSSSSDGFIIKTIKDSVVKILTLVIPKANPDFDHLIDKVEFWKIEFDTNDNAPWREIGFDKNGNSIVAMPLGRNYGFWTDNQLTLDDYEHFEPTAITSDEFEKDWKEFEEKTLANKMQHPAL